MTKKLTPAQQQRFDLKQEHKDCLLLFRLGDFYELFHDDAHVAHKVLALTLTAKNKKSDNPIPMAGIPYHALPKYLPKLVQAWYKVAIAEQVGAVVPWSVVKREIVEIITPGTFIEENSSQNTIAWCWFGGDVHGQYHCAWGDFTLGQFRTKSFEWFTAMSIFLQWLHPTELIVDSLFPEREQLLDVATQLSIWSSLHDHPHDVQHHIKELFGVQSLDGFWKALEWWRIHALSLVLSYIQQYQKRGSLTLHGVTYEWTESTVQLDAITVKNLEIFRSSYEWTEKHSLYGVINTCKTAVWKRLLRDWLLYPLRDPSLIQSRYEIIRTYAEQYQTTEILIKDLGQLIDIPRVMSRIIYRTPSPLVVIWLRNVLETILASEQLRPELSKKFSDSSHIETLSKTLTNALSDTFERAEHGFIASWWSKEVDRLRQVAFHSDELLTSYHQLLVEKVWTAALKIKFSKNQWYSIEVPKKHAETVIAHASPDDEQVDFIRVQSLKSWERFTTTYLQQLQQDIIDAQQQLHTKEYEILHQLITVIQQAWPMIERLCDSIACIDIAATMSVRLSQQRVLPTIQDGNMVAIKAWRHPVVEAFLPSSEQFIPNDCLIHKDRHFHLITWPNMWGKSTYLRQNALLLLMAHAWLPVPAKEMQFSIVDGIFARVWSGDALAKNQSTFMTEMIEMANIVRNATSNSFVVLDELGRGTSTYDGMSLAKALCVYICQEIKVPTLFATHYHELTALEHKIHWFINMSVSVYETNNEVVFLKKIVEWWANKSYGIDVAKLAWIPEEILQKAQQYLNTMGKETQQEPLQQQFDFWAIDDAHKRTLDAIKAELEGIDKDELSPIEWLIKLHKILWLLW